MTKNETLTILAMLNAFYAGGKNDPQVQVNAWHLILQKYDFNDAKEAVLNFAERDTREYATFPAVGLIVNEIRKVQKSRNDVIAEIIVGVSYGRPYELISDKAHMLISEKLYDEWLNMKADEFQVKSGTLKQVLKQRQKQLGGGNDRHN